MGLGTGAASGMDHTVRSGLSPAYSPQLSTLQLSKQSPCCALFLFPEPEPRLLGRRRAGGAHDLCPGAGWAPRPHSGGPKSCTAAPGPALPLLRLLYPRLLCSGCLQELVWMRPKGAARSAQSCPKGAACPWAVLPRPSRLQQLLLCHPSASSPGNTSSCPRLWVRWCQPRGTPQVFLWAKGSVA